MSMHALDHLFAHLQWKVSQPALRAHKHVIDHHFAHLQ